MAVGLPMLSAPPKPSAAAPPPRLLRPRQLPALLLSSASAIKTPPLLLASAAAQLPDTAAPASFPALQPAATPFNVLVTGSSKGLLRRNLRPRPCFRLDIWPNRELTRIGYALAKEFLRVGDKVLVCSRSGENVEKVVEELRQEFGEQRTFGMAVDVRDGRSVEALAAFAKIKLGYIDIWINNAGSNAYTYKPLVETSDEVIMEIVETNTIGVMICCREAIKMMTGQERGGHIFNMDGAGADGRPTPRFAAYGASKRSIVQLTKSLQAEMKMQGIDNVVVHMLSPGMVTTDLLMSGSDTSQIRFFFLPCSAPFPAPYLPFCTLSSAATGRLPFLLISDRPSPPNTGRH